MRVSALCGSLRSGSYNQALLDTATQHAEAVGIEIVQVPIGEFAPFDQDAEGAPPAFVTEAKRVVRSSECLLLATPEFNYGVPGVLKNAIDWLSRPSGDPTLTGRPLALMGASTGRMGTIRAQMAWRQLWHYFRAPVFSDVELAVAAARDKFSDGRLTDPATIELLDAYLGALHAWLERCR